MTLSFDFDRVEVSKTDKKEDGVGSDKRSQELESVKMQNTVLVDTFFTDAKLVKIFNDAISPDKVRKKLRDTIFTVSILIAFIAGAVASLSVWSGIGALIPFMFVYLVYIMFFRNLVEKTYINSKLNKLKNIFETQENLYSFLDSLINNKYIGSSLTKDYNINAGSSEWDSQLKALFYRAPSDEIRELFSKMGGDLSDEVLHWNLKHFLHRYYMSGSDKDLLFFLNQISPILNQKLTSDQMKTEMGNKKDLFYLISNKIDK